jgi:hypothetical protein
MPWAKGQSGNPGGRAKSTAEVKRIRELARQNVDEAYQVLLDLMRNGESDSVRRACARDLLDMAGVTAKALEDAEQPDAEANPCAGKSRDDLLRIVHGGTGAEPR